MRRSAFGGDDGPIDRLRKAAFELTQWRDFTAPWTRNPFDRRSEIDSLVLLLHEVAELSRTPASRNDPLFVGTDPVRRLSDEISLQQDLDDDTPADYDGWEAGLVDLSRDRVLANLKTGPRRRRTATASRATASCRRSLTFARVSINSGWRRTPIWQRYSSRSCAVRSSATQSMKAKAGALDFLDLLLIARDLVRDNRQVREGFQQRFKRIFVDEFQDTDPLQAEILLLLAADDPGETDWRRAKPLPGRLFLVGDPKQSIYRFRRADVAIYRDVCVALEEWGATRLHLTTSFRSVPEIQAFVNAAFAPVMTGDEFTLQADYVPLDAHRPALDRAAIDRRAARPRAVRTPVRHRPRRSSSRCPTPSARSSTGSSTTAAGRSPSAAATRRSRSSAKHICLLFRRFVSWETDVTRPYVEALEARGIPHVLVGGRAFHEREEVEALRAALTAIEWPDDELSVFATLRGPFFAIGDEELLEWAHHFGRTTGERFSRGSFHPFRVPKVFDENTPTEIAHLRPIAEALWLLQRLHRHRNYVRAGVRTGARGSARLTLERTQAACRERCRSCSRRRARTSASRYAPAASRRSPTCCTSPSWRGSTRWAAASRSAVSSRSCGSRPRRRRRPRRRSSRKTATASA